MKVVLVILTVGLIAQVILLAYAGVRIERLQAALAAAAHGGDRKAQRTFIAGMWAKVRGEALRQAARDWDSVSNQPVLDRMRREWKPGDSGVVTQWLTQRAEKVEQS